MPANLPFRPVYQVNEHLGQRSAQLSGGSRGAVLVSRSQRHVTTAPKPEGLGHASQPVSAPHLALAELGGGTPASGLYRSFFKRAIDIGAILVSLPMVLPLILILALLVAREGGRPFYSQLRVGKGGKPFRMWKLRTMVVDADSAMKAYLAANPDAKSEWDLTQKLRNDPRITKFGRFLRRSSLDELPQLWNVLRGDMSLIGPRPMMIEQRGLYPGKAYYRLRPGLTGSWQTEGRNSTTFEARATFDDDYDRNLSFGQDIRILAKTVGVVCKGTGV